MNVAAINAMDRARGPKAMPLAILSSVAYAKGTARIPATRLRRTTIPATWAGRHWLSRESHADHVSFMPDDATGWSALYQKWARIFAGNRARIPTPYHCPARPKSTRVTGELGAQRSGDLGVSQNTRLIDWYKRAMKKHLYLWLAGGRFLP